MSSLPCPGEVLFWIACVFCFFVILFLCLYQDYRKTVPAVVVQLLEQIDRGYQMMRLNFGPNWAKIKIAGE